MYCTIEYVFTSSPRDHDAECSDPNFVPSVRPVAFCEMSGHSLLQCSRDLAQSAARSARDVRRRVALRARPRQGARRGGRVRGRRGRSLRARRRGDVAIDHVLVPLPCRCTLAYRAVQWRNRDARAAGGTSPRGPGSRWRTPRRTARYGALHDAHAGNVRDLVLRMRGFYFKNAQLLSTRDDFVPPPVLGVVQARRRTRRRAEMRPGEARAIVGAASSERSRARTRRGAIAEWERDPPCGVASIGTVHAARNSQRSIGSRSVVRQGAGARDRAQVPRGHSDVHRLLPAGDAAARAAAGGDRAAVPHGV